MVKMTAPHTNIESVLLARVALYSASGLLLPLDSYVIDLSVCASVGNERVLWKSG